LHLAGTLFPHINDEARSKSHQILKRIIYTDVSRYTHNKTYNLTKSSSLSRPYHWHFIVWNYPIIHCCITYSAGKERLNDSRIDQQEHGKDKDVDTWVQYSINISSMAKKWRSNTPIDMAWIQKWTIQIVTRLE